MCAVVGIYENSDALRLTSAALFALQHRGHEASGISLSTIGNSSIQTIKGVGYVSDIFNDNTFSQYSGNIAIGHNRYSTVRGSGSKNIQPIQAEYKLGQIALVHNGNLIDKDEVRKRLISNGAIFQSDMDSENLIHLIAQSKASRLQYRIIEALKCVKGAYSLIIKSKNQMFAIRDKYAIRPLSIAKLDSGGYIVASETCCFDIVNAKFIRDVKPGEMVIFKPNGDIESIILDTPDPHPCAFEFIYFSRPDSTIGEKSVYKVRENLGRELAKEDAGIKADMVIAVPDSGIPATIGYSKQSGIPFRVGIIRNHYVGRTFIEPTQTLRDIRVKMKLTVMKEVVNGKSVIVVDDSIVRGTTSKLIIKMLKKAGAKEVHFRSSSPKVIYPERYGIDTPTSDELIANNKTESEIKDFLGSDSLRYLTLNGLKNVLGKDQNYSYVSFDGNYFIK